MAKKELNVPEKGAVFSDWTVIGDKFETKQDDIKSNKKRILCKCVCGVEKSIRYQSLLNGESKGCIKCKTKRLRQTNLEKYGVENPSQLASTKERSKKTNLERYGVEYASQSQEFKEKVKNSNLEKYGVDHNFKIPEVAEKIKKTNLERYGTEFALQSPKIKEKIRKTNLERYGTENHIQSPIIREKIKKTNLERYGVELPLQSNEIREKVKKTNLERYGTEFALQSLEIMEKIKKTNLDRYGTEFTLQSPKFIKESKKNNLAQYGFEYLSQAPGIKEKIKQTNLERYGTENASQSPKIKEKIRKTNLERYGTENHIQSPIIREKIKKTNLERYGVENPFQFPVVREKIAKTMSEQNGRSSTELELVNFIESLGFSTKKTFIGGSDPKEIDIHVPEKNLYIEFNGEYWHSEKTGRDHKYHLNKTLGCLKQNNSHLIHIFESEWINKQQIVKNFLKSKLFKGKSIRASKCEVKEIEKSIAYEFCNSYHLQGRPNSSILNLGLYFEDELISVMTFSKPHRQNMDKNNHLSRYAIKPDFRVYGGLSKMSKRAFSIIGEFITYVHYRLSNGDSYEKAGYERINLSSPDYWYWDTKKNKIVSKQSRKKSNVNTPKGMTEKQHAELDGLTRIWDCGKIKFAYRGNL